MNKFVRGAVTIITLGSIAVKVFSVLKDIDGKNTIDIEEVEEQDEQ